MPVQRINPDSLSKPATGFTQVVKAGNTVYISGQVATDRNGNLVGKDDGAAQAEKVFQNLRDALASAGASLRDVTKITVYMTHREDIPAMRRVREKYLASNYPASTLILVQGLVDPEYRIEIEATAVIS